VDGMTLKEFNDSAKMSYEIAATYFYIGTYIGNRGQIKTGIRLMRLAQSYLPRSKNVFKRILEPTLDGRLILFVHLGRLAPTSAQHSKYNFNVQQYKSMFEMFSKHIPESALSLIKLGILLYAQGGSLQAERLMNSTVDVLPIAKSITEATRADYFPLLAPTTTTAIVEASFVQTKYLMNLQRVDKDVMNDLKQNLTALNVMAARSELVVALHGKFIAELTKFVDIYDEVHTMDFDLLNRFQSTMFKPTVES
jgi:hypothetical protein